MDRLNDSFVEYFEGQEELPDITQDDIKRDFSGSGIVWIIPGIIDIVLDEMLNIPTRQDLQDRLNERVRQSLDSTIETAMQAKDQNHDSCLPAYNKGHTFDAGIDLYCAEDTILPGITVIGDPIKVTRIPTNISVAIPVGYVGDIRPKSGLSSKGWLIHYGTVDSGYRGLIQVNVSA